MGNVFKKSSTIKMKRNDLEKIGKANNKVTSESYKKRVQKFLLENNDGKKIVNNMAKGIMRGNKNIKINKSAFKRALQKMPKRSESAYQKAANNSKIMNFGLKYQHILNSSKSKSKSKLKSKSH